MTTEASGRVEVAYPDDVSVPVYLTTGLTLTDGLRIGLPAVGGGLVFGMPGAVAGAAAGAAISKVPVKGATVHRHMRNALDDVVTGYILDAEEKDSPSFKDDCFKLPDETFLAAVRVTSCDIANRGTEEQLALRGLVHDLYREMDYGVDVVSMEEGVDITEHAVDQDTIVRPIHVAFVRAKDPETVRERRRQVRTQLTGNDLLAMPVMGDDLMNLIGRLWVTDVSAGMRRYSVTYKDRSAEQHRALAVTGYPDRLGVGWLADVLKADTPGKVTVIQRVRPADDSIDWVESMADRAQVGAAIMTSPVKQTAFKEKAEDAEDMLRADDSLVRYEMLVTVRGEDENVVDTSLDRVKRVLRRHNITFQEPLLRTRRMAAAQSPLHAQGLGTAMVMPAGAAAGGFAFGTADAVEEDGVVFGMDRRDGAPVILDRFGWDAGHVAVMGKIGSGKSFFTKLVLLRSAAQYDDLQVFVVDPKQEYGGIVDALDMERCQRVTVDDRATGDDEGLVEAVRDAYAGGCEWSGKTIAVVDEAHRLLKDEDGRNALGRMVREGRDEQIAAHLVTQNSSDFTRSQEGSDILKNVDAHVFMRHQDVAASVEEFFDLSAAERVKLRKLRTGSKVGFSEAVIRGPLNTTLRIEALPDEEELITEAEE